MEQRQITTVTTTHTVTVLHTHEDVELLRLQKRVAELEASRNMLLRHLYRTVSYFDQEVESVEFTKNPYLQGTQAAYRVASKMVKTELDGYKKVYCADQATVDLRV